MSNPIGARSATGRRRTGLSWLPWLLLILLALLIAAIVLIVTNVGDDDDTSPPSSLDVSTGILTRPARAA